LLLLFSDATSAGPAHPPASAERHRGKALDFDATMFRPLSIVKAETLSDPSDHPNGLPTLSSRTRPD
jgi:hypothetical protein